MFWIALTTMIGATLAQHLGLSEAIAEIVTRICSCHMCLTFWMCLFVLIIVLALDPIISAVLSIAMAYLSNWFALILMGAQKIYTKLWQRLRNKQPRKQSR